MYLFIHSHLSRGLPCGSTLTRSVFPHRRDEQVRRESLVAQFDRKLIGDFDLSIYPALRYRIAPHVRSYMQATNRRSPGISALHYWYKEGVFAAIRHQICPSLMINEVEMKSIKLIYEHSLDCTARHGTARHAHLEEA